MKSFAVVLLVAVSVSVAGQERRVHRLSYTAPPESLDAMVASAEVIVRGSVVAREQRLLKDRDDALPTVAITIKIKQALKGGTGIRPGATIVFTQPGGTAVAGGIEHLVDDSEFPVVSDGEDVVLFLAYEKVYGTYASKWGPWSVWRIRGGDQGTVGFPRGVSGVGLGPQDAKRQVSLVRALETIRKIVDKK